MKGHPLPADKQRKVSSFLEVAVGQSADTALQFLEATRWQLDDAIQLFYVESEGGAMASSNYIPPDVTTTPLVDQSSREMWNPSRGSAMGAFRNFEQEYKDPGVWASEEVGPSVAQSYRDKLANLYRRPYGLMCSGPFEKAKLAAASEDKWLVANVQSTVEFSSHQLNRDTWSDKAVAQYIETNFIFWQDYDYTSEGKKVCSYYEFESGPVVLIINPITGQKVHSWSGMIAPDQLLEYLVPLIDDGGPKSQCSSLSNMRRGESSRNPARKVQVVTDEEDKERRRALAVPMEGMKHSKDGSAVPAEKKPVYPTLTEESKVGSKRRIAESESSAQPPNRTVSKNSKKWPDWTKLPDDIVESIAMRLEWIVDRPRLKAVCKSWRQVMLSCKLSQLRCDVASLELPPIELVDNTHVSVFLGGSHVFIISLPPQRKGRMKDAWLAEVVPLARENTFTLLDPSGYFRRYFITIPKMVGKLNVHDLRLYPIAQRLSLFSTEVDRFRTPMPGSNPKVHRIAGKVLGGWSLLPDRSFTLVANPNIDLAGDTGDGLLLKWSTDDAGWHKLLPSYPPDDGNIPARRYISDFVICGRTLYAFSGTWHLAIMDLADDSSTLDFSIPGPSAEVKYIEGDGSVCIRKSNSKSESKTWYCCTERHRPKLVIAGGSVYLVVLATRGSFLKETNRFKYAVGSEPRSVLVYQLKDNSTWEYRDSIKGTFFIGKHISYAVMKLPTRWANMVCYMNPVFTGEEYLDKAVQRCILGDPSFKKLVFPNFSNYLLHPMGKVSAFSTGKESREVFDDFKFLKSVGTFHSKLFFPPPGYWNVDPDSDKWVTEWVTTRNWTVSFDGMCILRGRQRELTMPPQIMPPQVTVPEDNESRKKKKKKAAIFSSKS